MASLDQHETRSDGAEVLSSPENTVLELNPRKRHHFPGKHESRAGREVSAEAARQSEQTAKAHRSIDAGAPALTYGAARGARNLLAIRQWNKNSHTAVEREPAAEHEPAAESEPSATALDAEDTQADDDKNGSPH
jgi:hypothetical protein